MSRQTAHALRRKAGAASFAAAWDAAAAFAEQAAMAGRGAPPSAFGLETIWVPRFYRGRLVGFVAREDHGEALRTLAALDHMVGRMDDERSDAARAADFEALLAALDPKAAETDAIRP